jgi:hypothetical protein
VTLTAASSKKTYDGTALTDVNVSASGLPDGFTVKATTKGSRINVGSSINEIIKYQIFKDGKDVTSRFKNVKLNNGMLTVTKASIKIETSSDEKKYDGTALTNTTASITGLASGETATVITTGSITQVGSVDNTYIIEWGTANANNYRITDNLGTLTVTKKPIEIKTGSAEKVYDGTALTSAAAEIKDLVQGETATVTTTGSITDAGTADNTYEIEWGTADPDNYEITDNLGTLSVTKMPVKIETASAEKVYDGTALTDSTIIIGDLASGETATVTTTGSITDAGSAVNTYEIDWGTTKPDNYEITEVLGTLTVTPLPVTFNLFCSDSGYEYEGYIIVPECFEGYYADETSVECAEQGYRYNNDYPVAVYGDFNLIGGDKLHLEAGGHKDAGTYTIVPEETFSSGNAGNYSISYASNTMIITKAAATVYTGSARKEYDGTPLTCSETEIDGLVGNDVGQVTVTATGTITEPGSTQNTYTIDWGTVNPDNYILSLNLGTLTVEEVFVPSN